MSSSKNGRPEHSRRNFLALAGVTGAAVLAGVRPALAADMPHLAESDPTAKALGYTEDAGKVDKTKFPNHAAGQHCAACLLYQGLPTAPTAPCVLFAGRQVAGPGWCSAFALKPPA